MENILEDVQSISGTEQIIGNVSESTLSDIAPDLFNFDVTNATQSNILKDLKKFAKEIADEIKNDPNHGYLLLSLAVALIWFLYIILYNSRVLGQIVTAVLRRFIKHGQLEIGSVSISPLWGKLMFRNIIYVTEDYSFRVVDAIVQFHYWVPYQRKELHEDMSKCDHRLWIELNGPELHIYNRSELYSKLEEAFGLEPQLIPKANKRPAENKTAISTSSSGKDMKFWSSWRDILPVIKIDLNMARFVFGNSLIPSTLILTADKAECIYSTKPAMSHLDFFMHVLKIKAENFRVILAPSPKYTGILDEPPRYMGEGFVVMSSSRILFYYYMDEAGLVPFSDPDILIENGDEGSPAPIWGLDVKCEKGTSLSYGPWADRQREQLFKFFFPQDYKEMEVVTNQKPGTVRQALQFDFRLAILTEATIDILFSKENVTNAVHMTVQKGSCFEMTLPWVVQSEGYVVHIVGQFLYLDASTSLQYRNLIEAELFKYEVKVKYPLRWNKHQNWDMNFYGSKASYHFLYAHKTFFHDLINDWSTKALPDLLHFVPYTWQFYFSFKQFELITLANEYNWIDCSSQHQVNAHVAVCGEGLELKFKLPFVSFLPETVPLKFLVKGKTLYLSLFLPPYNTTSSIIAAMDKNAKIFDKDSNKIFHSPSWRKFCKLSNGWIDCWQVPELELVIGYTYHPIVPLGPSPQANVSTPEKLELLLSPIRAPKKRKSPNEKAKKLFPEKFNPLSMPADVFCVDLRILQPSDLKLYGAILRHFIHLKENIFGEDQKFIDMSEPTPYEKGEEERSTDEVSKYIDEDKKDEEFDERKFRPFEVTVNINIRRVQGHLMKDCSIDDPHCPVILMDRLVFEMTKKYQETRMQVLLSPLLLKVQDSLVRPQLHTHISQGFAVLSGFQMRGHAMFSDEGLSLYDETLEYSWLVEMTVGSLVSKLTAPQLLQLVTGVETFLFTAMDTENCLRHPRPFNICHHGDPQPECSHTVLDHFCPSIDLIKYKMIRVSLDAIDFHLVESGTDLNLQVFPIRFSTCNLHGQHTKSGVTAHIEKIRIRNLISGWVGAKDTTRHHGNNDLEKSTHTSSAGFSKAADVQSTNGAGTSIGGVNSSSNSGSIRKPCDFWVEAAALNFGPLYIDCAISSNILHHDMQHTQYKFLKLHDRKMKRLWFLWSSVDPIKPDAEPVGRCGCVGGCNFFGCNRNGPLFFKPSQKDFIDGLNIAQCRVNDTSTAPGYGQSILKTGQLVFNQRSYYTFTQPLFGTSSTTEKSHLNLSSGYAMSCCSPATNSDFAENQENVELSSSVLHPSDVSNESTVSRHSMKSSHTSQDLNSSLAAGHSFPNDERIRSKYSASAAHSCRIGESSSLGRQTTKEPPFSSTGEPHTSPSSLLDLSTTDFLSPAQQHKNPSSLSLQVGERRIMSKTGTVECSSASNPMSNDSSGTPTDPRDIFQRTVSIGSEMLSDAFYSAEEDLVMLASRKATSASPSSSQVSLPAVAEYDVTLRRHSEAIVSQSSRSLSMHSALDPKTTDQGSPTSRTRNGDSSTASSSSRSSSSSRVGDLLSGSRGHSQTSLLHSSDESELSNLGETTNRKRKRARQTLTNDYVFQDSDVDLSSGGESVSSNSFISAFSSQDDIALVNLHIQLNKPIMESPLLMSSYVNHMTQLRCKNWDGPIPSFEDDKKGRIFNPPCFEKINEGFTSIRMVEGPDYYGLSSSPQNASNSTPSHPYSWNNPLFTWGEVTEESQAEMDDAGTAIFDSNTVRTTLVMKLKKDIDVTVSPISVECLHKFIEVLTPLMESLHPLSIVNAAHFKSVKQVEQKNKLKKDRYMYWSKIRDGKKSSTPDQAHIVSSTYQECGFQQIQGQLIIPRINVSVLQASIVEEIISFSALDNIRDLTCVSLFSFCLDGVCLNFHSSHQSKQSVQILRRNPKALRKPKKAKSKAKQSLDLFSDPVYIETSEKQQEENMISVSVNKLHVQLRRLRNESSLLKDASITAIPNHRSKVMFTFKRSNNSGESCANETLTPQPTSTSHLTTEERMGFIVFEAGLENIAIKAVKRKGFGCQLENANGKISSESAPSGGSTSHATAPGKESVTASRRESGVIGVSASGESGSIKAAVRLNVKLSKKSGISKPENLSAVSEGSASAPEGVFTPPDTHKQSSEDDEEKDLNETRHSSSSHDSSLTDHSAEIPEANLHLSGSPKEESQQQHSTKVDKKDITSFFIELSTVWFNFAAPPRTPITKKIDYTRLDWNFLSTASPSINAWMNPCDRLTVTVIRFLNSSESRRLGVMACLMAEALDVQSIHSTPKNKHSKLMPLSQTIQEDPSCQLCNVLRRFVLQSSLLHIESNLYHQHLPKLATLRQGIVALSRQWKSALYMPLLMEQSFKFRQNWSSMKKRMSHVEPSACKTEINKNADERTSIQQSGKESVLSNANEESRLNNLDDGEDEERIEQGEDEKRSLSPAITSRQTIPSFAHRSSNTPASTSYTQNSSNLPRRRRFYFPNLNLLFHETRKWLRTSRPQGLVETFKSPGRGVGASSTAVEEETQQNLLSFASNKKASSKPSDLDEPERKSLISEQDIDEELDESSRLPKEDLYNWMAKQHEHNQTSQTTRPTVTFNKGLDMPLLSEDSDGEYEENHEFTGNFFTSTDQPTVVMQEPQTAQFLEAHVIFEPLLSAIGVITQQVTAGAFEQLGANISVTGNIETLRMDIIESETSRTPYKRRKNKFYLDIGAEVPSFICEKIGLEIDIRKVADESRNWSCRQPTLFVSRSAFKQHTSTMINFSLNISYIAQQVNMPLLRLIHQITSMYQNAMETQMGLKEQRPSKTKGLAPLPPHSKELYSDLQYEGVFKTAEANSLSEEQMNYSTIDTIRSKGESRISSTSSGKEQGASSHYNVNSTGRPQSFAQKLKSSRIGYMKEKSSITNPIVTVSSLEDASDKSPLLVTPNALPMTPPNASVTPKCWRNLYYLVDLYAITPETKTVNQRQSATHDLTERYKTLSTHKPDLKEMKADDVESGLPSMPPQETSILTDKTKDLVYMWSERTPLVIFGLAKIQKTKLLATISGLKLEAEMNAMHSSITFREKVKGTQYRSTSEMSLTGHVGNTMIVLLEGIAPSQQTVVRVTIGKSQGLYSSLSRRSKNKNSALITIGPVQVDIPQHPIILHDMMTRGTKQLSSTLQELRVTRPSRLSRNATLDEPDVVPSPRPSFSRTPEPLQRQSKPYDSLLHPLTIQFSILLQEMSIHAALLPSLQATYCMQQVTSDGFTGAKANFKVQLSSHHLAFNTKLQELPNESTLPPSAKISLPQVHVEAQYIQDDASADKEERGANNGASDGMVLTEGNYLNAVADIGALEHSLTTDLLNHLVFVQKVFMKEVNEVVQKMAGSDKKTPLVFSWADDGVSTRHRHHHTLLLFNVQINLKGIIITATTPTNSAVRLETGTFELQLSNRVENVSQPQRTSAVSGGNPKIFGKAQVEVTLALGQLILNDLFNEIEPHFQQLAYFRTRIGLRNALHDELPSIGEEGEMVLINLTRPLICIQPLAIDKAVLVWLNYKNAYEYWNEQRASLNKEVLTATQQVFERVPQFSSLSSAAHIRSNLFLKLSVSDIGICLPINPYRTVSHQVDSTETRDALVVTLESTTISACNSGSLVCKAQFKDFCTRFAPDFETSLDEWKPDYRDRSIMNLCKVSEGTYEVCSRTVAPMVEKGENAKWLLNVCWQMEGMEMHLDVNIGKHLSSLARTLTMLTSAPNATEVVSTTDVTSDDEQDSTDHTPQDSGNLPAFIFDTHMDPRKRAKLLEIEMNEQAKIVNDLKVLGASPLTIDLEVKRLKELEQIVSNDFRRDMLMKIRRQSIKATSMKDRLGLGPKLQMRSKSFRVPSPTVEVREPSRHCSIASASTDSIGGVDDTDFGDVFVPSLPSRVKFSRKIREKSPHPELDPSISVEVLEDDVFPLSGNNYSIPHSESSGNYQSREGSTHNASGQSAAASIKRQDPSIDLELDVNVCISSGECLLYNEDFSKLREKDKEKEDENKSKLKKERSFSGICLQDMPSSPSSVRRRHDLRNIVGSRLRNLNQSTPTLDFQVTVFFIPGLDVKVRYESHNIHDDTPLTAGKVNLNGPSTVPPETSHSHQDQFFFNENFKRSNSSPRTSSSRSRSHAVPVHLETTTDENTSAFKPPTALPLPFTSGSRGRGHSKRAFLFTWLTLQSIPEETVISPCILDFLEKVLEPLSHPEPVKTSIISPVSTEPEMEFGDEMDSLASGLPAAGAYGYASFPVDVIVYFHMKPSAIRFSSLPVLRVECLLKLPSLDVIFSSKRAEESIDPSVSGKGSSATGGLSVTGALEDFSLFVFHPYGSKNVVGRPTPPSSSTSKTPLNESDRKDFLSVVVEFVKFHISRSRKIHFIKPDPLASKGTENAKAIIRFSTIIDIGAALFKYDMRHITEILAFPKAWYRRALVRRLFLGDMNTRSKSSYMDAGQNSEFSSNKRHSANIPDGRRGGPSGTQATTPTSGAAKSDHQSKRERKRLGSDAEGSHFTPKPTNKSDFVNGSSGSWETLVQFAVNFTKLNVHMNMRNVMGHAVWTTKGFKSNGRLSIGSTGHKNLYLDLGLGGSSLEARGGIVGGLIEITDINLYLKIREDPCTEPDHVIGVKLLASHSRLDYMGTSVLMGRVSSFGLTLKDEWKLKQCAKDEDDSTRRGATIFILGDIEWDQLQLVINKSTTADLLKMHNRLQEFFSQQFNSSKLVFSSFHTDGSGVSSKAKERQAESNRKMQIVMSNSNFDPRHHRHWQKVLSRVSGLKLSTLPLPLPFSGTVLGGSLELHGKSILLACFHGINFKSKSWALFSLREPFINFTSEVQEIPNEEANRDTHVVQNLTFCLGIIDRAPAQHVSLAKVNRITRNHVFPPQFRSLQEWFHYALCPSDLDDVDRFPTLDENRMDSLNSSGESKRVSPRVQEHNHSSETIFAFPSLEIHLSTKQLQPAGIPDMKDKKPTVDCSLVTEFQDHIFVTIDADHFFFLHDLINSYIKDTKEKLPLDSDSKTNEKVVKVNEPTQILQQDWREYKCSTWHLEPTVRLLSWATRNLEPYGVDFILNKLGFSHADTTIPKWLQRGCMDPLDTVLSVLLYRLIAVIHEHDSASSK